MPTSDDDRRAFIEATRDVRPIAPDDRVPRMPRKPKPKAKATRRARSAVMEDSLAGHWPEAAHGEIEFRQPGISRQTLRQLRSGRFSIEAEIDLHGMTRAEAQRELKAFVLECIDRGVGCIRVVHGKGTRSGQGGPVLKSSVHHWLAQWEEILAYASARVRDGGSGAVYVLLARR
jgi:DNA-nicking Smr family endonuclease